MPEFEELKRAALDVGLSGEALEPLARGRYVARSAVAHNDRGERIRRIEDLVPLRDLPPVEMEWVLPDLLPLGTLNLFASSPGGGKSTLAYALAGAVAMGRDFAGRAVSRRPVLVLDRENPEVKVREILARFQIEDGDGLTIWGGWAAEEAAAPASALVVEWALRQPAAPLVVVDSLVAFLRADENDARAVREFIHPLRRLADRGLTFLFLHHSGKGEGAKRYRGSSDIPAALDQCWAIEKATLGTQLTGLTMRAFKTRFATTEALALEVEGGAFVEVRGGAGGGGADGDFKALRKLLIERGAISKSGFERVAGQQGLGRNAVRSFLAWAEKKGLLEVGRGEKGGAHLVSWKAEQQDLPGLLEHDEASDG